MCVIACLYNINFHNTTHTKDFILCEFFHIKINLHIQKRITHHNKPGQAIGSMHRPFNKTSPLGQKHPSAHPPGQSEVKFFMQVCKQSDPHC